MEDLSSAATVLPAGAWAQAGRKSKHKILMGAFEYWSVMINPKTYFKIHFILKLTAALAVLMSGTCGWAEANGDRVAYKLEDPSRPASVRAHLLNGGITVKGSAGNEVIVEARVRGGGEYSDNEGRLKR